MSANSGSDGKPVRNDEVGYRRPPKNTQFRKGRSGNPRGRPKRPQEFRDVLLEILNQKLSGIENGKRRRMSRLELGMVNLANNVAKGNRLAWRDLLITMERFGIKLSAGPGGGITFIIEE